MLFEKFHLSLIMDRELEGMLKGLRAHPDILMMFKCMCARRCQRLCPKSKLFDVNEIIRAHADGQATDQELLNAGARAFKIAEKVYHTNSRKVQLLAHETSFHRAWDKVDRTKQYAATAIARACQIDPYTAARSCALWTIDAIAGMSDAEGHPKWEAAKLEVTDVLRSLIRERLSKG